MLTKPEVKENDDIIKYPECLAGERESMTKCGEMQDDRRKSYVCI